VTPISVVLLPVQAWQQAERWSRQEIGTQSKPELRNTSVSIFLHWASWGTHSCCLPRDLLKHLLVSTCQNCGADEQ